jgi:hypothetical protein
MDLVFITNQKGGRAVLYNGHKYNFGYTNKKTGYTMWRCVNRSEQCNASITIDEIDGKVARESEHVCRSHYEENIRDVVMDTCKKAVCTEMSPVRKIFEKAVVEMHDVDQEFIMSSYEEKKETLRRTRLKFLGLAKSEFTVLEDVKIANIISQIFLVFDDGTNDKMLIFSTLISRQYLESSAGQEKQYFGDGTFKSTPRPFYQIYSIHIDASPDRRSTNVIPVVFALLPNKREETYYRLFSFLRQTLNMTIDKFKCDFETAVINACKAVFPDVQLTGCHFHFARAVNKKAKSLNMVTNEEREIVTLCANLPLLPAAEINNCWLDILDMAPNTHTMLIFKQYMERQWIRLGGSIISCAQDRHRTNNPVEGFHRRLNTRMPRNPTLMRFLYKLKSEAKWQDYRIKNSLFTVSSRKRREIYFDNQYQQQKRELNNGVITSVQFLKNVCLLKRRLH